MEVAPLGAYGDRAGGVASFSALFYRSSLAHRKPAPARSCLKRPKIPIAGTEALYGFQPGAAAHGFDGAVTVTLPRKTKPNLL
jgi:hypothetical protein